LLAVESLLTGSLESMSDLFNVWFRGIPYERKRWTYWVGYMIFNDFTAAGVSGPSSPLAQWENFASHSMLSFPTVPVQYSRCAEDFSLR
jgi:hypothetical protein